MRRRRTDRTLKEFIVSHPWTTTYIAVVVTINLVVLLWGHLGG